MELGFLFDPAVGFVVFLGLVELVLGSAHWAFL